VSWSGWTPRSFVGVGGSGGSSVGGAVVDVPASGTGAGERGGLGFFFFFFLVMAESLVPFRRRVPTVGGGW